MGNWCTFWAIFTPGAIHYGSVRLLYRLGGHVRRSALGWGGGGGVATQWGVIEVWHGGNGVFTDMAADITIMHPFQVVSWQISIWRTRRSARQWLIDASFLWTLHQKTTYVLWTNTSQRNLFTTSLWVHSVTVLDNLHNHQNTKAESYKAK